MVDLKAEVSGLSLLEFRNLQSVLGTDKVVRKNQNIEVNQHNEPGTIIATVVTSALVLNTLVLIFVARNRKESSKTIKITVKDEKQGTITAVELHQSDSITEALSDETVKALCSAFKIDLKSILEAFGCCNGKN